MGPAADVDAKFLRKAVSADQASFIGLPDICARPIATRAAADVRAALLFAVALRTFGRADFGLTDFGLARLACLLGPGIRAEARIPFLVDLAT